MRIKADLYSGRLFEYWEPKARPLDATRLQNQLESTRANITYLNAELEAYLDELATLIGEEPGAWRTIAGYEAIHMIRKGQACWSAAGAKIGLLHRFILGLSAATS
jgi:hypothetical protein